MTSGAKAQEICEMGKRQRRNSGLTTKDTKEHEGIRQKKRPPEYRAAFLFSIFRISSWRGGGDRYGKFVFTVE